MKPEKRRGFTLIELMVVVVIISILVAMAMSRYEGFRENAYQSTVQNDLRVLGSYQEEYHAENFQYASNVTDLDMVQSEGVSLTVTESSGVGWAATGEHLSLVGEQCGYYFGQASASNASPATTPGVVTCTF